MLQHRSQNSWTVSSLTHIVSLFTLTCINNLVRISFKPTLTYKHAVLGRKRLSLSVTTRVLFKWIESLKVLVPNWVSSTAFLTQNLLSRDFFIDLGSVSLCVCAVDGGPAGNWTRDPRVSLQTFCLKARCSILTELRAPIQAILSLLGRLRRYFLVFRSEVNFWKIQAMFSPILGFFNRVVFFQRIKKRINCAWTRKELKSVRDNEEHAVTAHCRFFF